MTSFFTVPADTEDSRYCPECEQLKPFDQFYKDGIDTDGNIKYRRDCKECYKKRRLAAKKLKETKTKRKKKK